MTVHAWSLESDNCFKCSMYVRDLRYIPSVISCFLIEQVPLFRPRFLLKIESWFRLVHYSLIKTRGQNYEKLSKYLISYHSQLSITLSYSSGRMKGWSIVLKEKNIYFTISVGRSG